MDDLDTFSLFVRDTSGPLLQAAWLLTGDWHHAQDLLQTALAKTWPHWTHIRNQDAAGSYVRRAMTTTYLSWRSRRWSGEIPNATPPDRGTDGNLEESAVGRLAILAALSSLSRQQRTALVLRYFLDLSDSQTAEAMRCSIPTVKTHTSRGLVALRADGALVGFAPKGPNNG